MQGRSFVIYSRPHLWKWGWGMQICEVINNQDTYRADGSQTVLEVVGAMVARNIGAVPVLRDGLLIGIFSERDLMKRVVAECRDPRTTRLDEVMTEEPLTVSPSETPENCMMLMRRHGFRHLPICEGKQLLAVISLRDLLLHDLTEKDYEVRMMRAYIHSTPEV
jgi:signal-transduction protein with cAMP-binding, CBS, and nucleotidyltransferase domain